MAESDTRCAAKRKPFKWSPFRSFCLVGTVLVLVFFFTANRTYTGREIMQQHAFQPNEIAELVLVDYSGNGASVTIENPAQVRALTQLIAGLTLRRTFWVTVKTSFRDIPDQTFGVTLIGAENRVLNLTLHSGKYLVVQFNKCYRTKSVQQYNQLLQLVGEAID